MQLALNNTGYQRSALRNSNQQTQPTHEQLRDAVRAWAAAENQDVVAALIADEHRRQGGALELPADISRQRQKIFRWLDNDSNYAVQNVRALAPAILAVLPLEYRSRLLQDDCVNTRVAVAMKECAEAHRALLLDAPEREKMKEASEAIASLFRLMPEQAGALMTMVNSMLGTL